MQMQQSRWSRFSSSILLAAGLCRGADAAIDNANFTDTRGMSLGGAISASVDDAAAGSINPAALGFMARETESDVDNNSLGEQNFGWNVVGVGAGATLTGDLGDYLEILANIDFDKISTDKLKEPGHVKDLLSLAGTLGNITDKDTIVVNASMGTAMQIGHFGIGIRSFGQVGGWISNVDLVGLGLQIAAGEISDALEDAMAADPGFDPNGYTPETFNTENIDALRDAFGGALLDDDTLHYLDYKATELIRENDLDPDQIQGVADTLVLMIENSGGANGILDNQTSIVGRGFGAVEVPVSYGYALNDNFSLGVTAKVLFGRVYGTQVWAFNDSNTEIIQDTLDSSNDSVALGLDLAAMYRIPKWQFALVGHNLNSPRFDGYDQSVPINGTNQVIHVPDVVLDPQVTLGAAWFPFKRLMLASDFELLETGTLVNGYDLQRLSFGTELDLSLVALRLGTYRNIAESDYGWVLTGGLGLNLWALSVDLGAAISIDDTVNYDGTDYPRTARLYAAISLDF